MPVFFRSVCKVTWDGSGSTCHVELSSFSSDKPVTNGAFCFWTSLRLKTETLEILLSLLVAWGIWYSSDNLLYLPRLPHLYILTYIYTNIYIYGVWKLLRRKNMDEFIQKVVLGLQSWPFNWAPNSNLDRWIAGLLKAKQWFTLFFHIWFARRSQYIDPRDCCKRPSWRLQHGPGVVNQLLVLHGLLYFESLLGYIDRWYWEVALVWQEEAVYELETGKPRSLEELPSVISGMLQHPGSLNWGMDPKVQYLCPTDSCGGQGLITALVSRDWTCRALVNISVAEITHGEMKPTQPCYFYLRTSLTCPIRLNLSSKEVCSCQVQVSESNKNNIEKDRTII